MQHFLTFTLLSIYSKADKLSMTRFQSLQDIDSENFKISICAVVRFAALSYLSKINSA